MQFREDDQATLRLPKVSPRWVTSAVSTPRAPSASRRRDGAGANAAEQRRKTVLDGWKKGLRDETSRADILKARLARYSHFQPSPSKELQEAALMLDIEGMDSRLQFEELLASEPPEYAPLEKTAPASYGHWLQAKQPKRKGSKPPVEWKSSTRDILEGRLPKLNDQVGVDEQTHAEMIVKHERIGRPTGGPPDNAKLFRLALANKYPSLSAAWADIDANGDGVVRFNEFVAACRRMHFGGNLQKIFEELTAGADGLRPELLDPALPLTLAKHSDNTLSSLTLLTSRSSQKSADELLLQAAETRQKTGPPADARAFKMALIKKFGKLEYAWEEMDTNGDRLLQFHEFVTACRRMHFNGNLRQIFDELSNGRGNLRPQGLSGGLVARLDELQKLRDLKPKPDPELSASGFNHGHLGGATTLGEVHHMLNRPDARSAPPSDAKAFKAALIKMYGKLVYAWADMDGNEDGELQFHEFVAECRRVRFGGNLKKIFKELIGDNTVLTPAGLDPSLPVELDNLREGKMGKSLMDWGKKKSVVKHGFNHGHNNGAQTLGEVHYMMARENRKAPPPSDARTFKMALIKLYHKFTYAWLDMDLNEDGSLQFHEFVAACRRMHFSGSLKQIFTALTNGADALIPEHLDPALPAQLLELHQNKSSTSKTQDKWAGDFSSGRGKHCGAETMGEVHNLLMRSSRGANPQPDGRSFKLALLKKYEHLEYAWEDIDLNGDGVLQFYEFVAACRQMQVAGNLRKMFDELLGENESVLRPEALDAELPAKLANRDLKRKTLGAVPIINSPQLPSKTMEMIPHAPSTDFSHGRQCSAQTYAEVQKMLLERPGAKAGPPADARLFKLALLKKFGAMQQAWEAIDVNRDGVLQFPEFITACRRVQFCGNLRKVFDDLAIDGVIRAEYLGNVVPPEKNPPLFRRSASEGELSKNLLNLWGDLRDM